MIEAAAYPSLVGSDKEVGLDSVQGKTGLLAMAFNSGAFERLGWLRRHVLECH